MWMTRRANGGVQDGKFIWWPYKAPLFVYCLHSACGHGQNNWFYVIRNSKLVGPLIRVGSEVGGPIYRDVDHDGRPELVFDNYDYYRGDRSPDKFRVYKVSPGYRIRLWKTWPNPKHILVDRVLPEMG